MANNDNTFKKDIPVLNSFKGKKMHARGTYDVSKPEAFLLTISCILFIASTIYLVESSASGRLSILLLAASLIFMVLTWGIIVFKKIRQDPLDIHYYSVDEKANHITGTYTNNTEEISKEEFLEAKRKSCTP